MLDGGLCRSCWNQALAFVDEVQRVFVLANQHVNLDKDGTCDDRLRVCLDDLLEISNCFALVADNDVVERHDHLGIDGVGGVEHGLAGELGELLCVGGGIAPVVKNRNVVDQRERVCRLFAVDFASGKRREHVLAVVECFLAAVFELDVAMRGRVPPIGNGTLGSILYIGRRKHDVSEQKHCRFLGNL